MSKSEPSFLPYGRQSVDETDIEAVLNVLNSDYLSTGPEIERFERDFSDSVNVPHAVACNSATAALHLASDGLGIGQGDVCIVPTITFLATANAVLYTGADVVFADVDPVSGLLTPETLDEAFKRCQTPPRAVLPVHLGGSICDMPRLHDMARAHSMFIIEDACHAIGGEAFNAPIGACKLSDAATFSFHPVKTMTCGEGGMVTTENADLAGFMRETRTHGVTRNERDFERAQGVDEPWWYEMQDLGWNYRIPDINAALGRSQLKRLPDFVERRARLVDIYRHALIDLAPYIASPMAQADIRQCRHLFNISIDYDVFKINRIDVMAGLRTLGIGSQVHYIPVHRQPFYQRRYGHLNLPGAECYYDRTLSLPLYPAMTDDDPIRVIKGLKQVLGI